MRRVVTKGGTYQVKQPRKPEATIEIPLKAKAGPLRILVPPGVGDIHWVLLRLRGLLKQSGNVAHKPIVTVCSGDPAYDRAGDFLRCVPWISFGGYLDIRPKRWSAFTTASFFHGKVFTDMPGFDLFIAANKLVELGTPMDGIWPQAGRTDWDYPIEHAEQTIEAPERFILASFYKASFYADWWKASPPAEALLSIGKRLDDEKKPHKIVLVGAKWDEKVAAELRSAHHRVVDLTGKTSWSQLIWLKKRAAAMVGHPSGSPMIATQLGVPVVSIWGDWWQFSDGMRYNWCRPDVVHARRYRALHTKDHADIVADNVLEVMR